ncbi:MAG TPA: hypothetical protein VNO70_19520 [Blastocatellia bacterium]|nr:hypothetical protein [Blastocatellia bacterium]
MPIPASDENGFLPPGVHDCSLEEVRERFGAFQMSDQRCRLFEKLNAFIQDVRFTGIVTAIVIDGSFVTDKHTPNDIDLILILSGEYNFHDDPGVMEYNILSSRRVRSRYGFDIFVARENSREYGEYLEFFQQARGQPGSRKGVLRVEV